jgi:hypothetical protein
MRFNVPDDTTTNKKEFKPGRYVIPFAPELIAFILHNQKLTTYRFGNKYDYLNVGDLVNIQDSQSKEIVGTATVFGKSACTFKDLPLSTETHESYRDKEHQRTVQSGYYAFLGRPIADSDPFLVLSFKLVESTTDK